MEIINIGECEYHGTVHPLGYRCQRQAPRYFGVSERLFQTWLKDPEARAILKPHKLHGRLILYRLADLERFLSTRSLPDDSGCDNAKSRAISHTNS